MQTNLFDFLRRVLIDSDGPPPNCVNISEAEREWIRHFIQGPDVEIHFKAKKIDEIESEEPIMAQDYALKGNPEDIFTLLTEAMLSNGHFAEMVLLAGKFYKDHLPGCPDCKLRIANTRREAPTWEFITHKDF